MKTTIYYTGCDDGYSFSYLVKEKNRKIKLKAGALGWSEICGAKLAQLTDTGNGLIMKLRSGKKLELDYDEAEYVMLLLRFLHEDSELSTYKTKVRKFQIDAGE